MGKIAFVFAGQGAQSPGMGKDVYDAVPAVRDIFAKADAGRPGTSAQCFEADADELMQTKNTQPCVYTVDLAMAAALEAEGIHADMTAGYSLGELAALTYGGAMTIENGIKIGSRIYTAEEIASIISDEAYYNAINIGLYDIDETFSICKLKKCLANLELKLFQEMLKNCGKMKCKTDGIKTQIDFLFIAV